MSYRAEFPISDLLASETNNADEMKKQFFTARQILPNRPLTLLDYRKLLIDLKGVKNAWLQPAQLSYYADTIEGKLIGPATLFVDQIILQSFAARMKPPADAVSKFISGHFSPATQQALASYAGSGDDALLQTVLVLDLNRLIRGDSIYDPQRFAPVTLSAAAQTLLQQHPQDEALVRLNRLLLEDAYPTEILKNQELRDRVNVPSIVETKIRGLYDLTVEYMDDVTSAVEKTQVMSAIKERLQANRNLCEDFVSFTEVETQNFLLCAELELAPGADVAKVKAEILFQVQQYLAPPVPNYTLSEMLERKKADGTPFTVDEIFDGPALDCGFIDNDELIKANLRTEIYLSDVISIIMDIEGVRAVKEIVINPEGTSVPLAKKWIIAVADRKKALLNYEKSRLVFYKRNMPIIAASEKVKEHFAELMDTARSKAETVEAYDLELPLGTYRRPGDYYSFQNDFPALYGISEYGLSSAADDKRKALAFQLKAYLLFFDQILANYFAQLAHVKDLLSTDPNLQRTYFCQVVDSFAEYEKIYRNRFTPDDFVDLPSFAGRLKDASNKVSLFLKDHLSSAANQLLTDYTGADLQSQPLKEALAGELSALVKIKTFYDPARFTGVRLSDETQKLLAQNPQGEVLARLNRLLLNDAYPLEFGHYDVEDNKTFVDRRNRFLDHLIARFAERFTEFVQILHSAFGSNPKDVIGVKCEFLNNYPAISRDRSLAYNYSLQNDADLWNSENVSGLEKRLARLLGLQNFKRRNLSEVTYDSFAAVEPAGGEFTFRIRERNTGNTLLSSTVNYASSDLAQAGLTRAIFFALLPSGYERKTAADGKFSFNIIDDQGIVIANHGESFEKEAQRDKAIDLLIGYLQTNYSDEGMYLVEMILLLPERTLDPFLPICRDPNCSDCAEEDPYSYRIHVILPAYSSRFSNMDFRRFVEQVIREETPAHILPRICWISKDDMKALEKAYRDWIYIKAGAETTQPTDKLRAFSEVLFAVRNVYPPQRLHECDSGEDQPKFLLGQTALGTLR